MTKSPCCRRRHWSISTTRTTTAWYPVPVRLAEREHVATKSAAMCPSILWRSRDTDIMWPVGTGVQKCRRGRLNYSSWPPHIMTSWRRDTLCRCCLLESIPSTPLNVSLRNFDTWRVSVCNRTLQRVLGIAQCLLQKVGPQNYLCSMTSQLNGNFEGQYLPQGTRYRQSENGIGNHEGSPTSSQNFVNFGPLTAKNKIVVFICLAWLGGGGHHAGLPFGVPTFLV